MCYNITFSQTYLPDCSVSLQCQVERKKRDTSHETVSNPYFDIKRQLEQLLHICNSSKLEKPFFCNPTTIRKRGLSGLTGNYNFELC